MGGNSLPTELFASLANVLVIATLSCKLLIRDGSCAASAHSVLARRDHVVCDYGSGGWVIVVTMVHTVFRLGV